MKKTKILFVCLGNICRSPLAEGVFIEKLKEKHLSEKYVVESCGTGSWHIGNPPDPGSCEVAKRNGFSIDHQRARTLMESDLHHFDHIIAMDQSNLRNISSLAQNAPDILQKVSLMREYEVFKNQSLDVPDPYSMAGDAFLEVYEILDRCCEVLLEEIEK